MQAHKIGIIGLGKIAQDQHIPVIKGNPAFELVAVASQRGLTRRRRGARGARLPPASRVAGGRCRRHLHAAADAPSRSRGKRSPPASTCCWRSRRRRRPASWSTSAALPQRAAGRSSPPGTRNITGRSTRPRRWLAGQTVRRLRIAWKEDVRKWHPGQRWIWQAGGFGVFDPGINALSIMTKDPARAGLRAARRAAVPGEPDAPIAADIEFGVGNGRGRSHGRLRLAADRRRDLGHRDRDGRRIDARSVAGRQPPRDRRPPRRRRGAGRISAHLRALRRPAAGRPVGGRRGTLAPRRRCLPARPAARRRALRRIDGHGRRTHRQLRRRSGRSISASIRRPATRGWHLRRHRAGADPADRRPDRRRLAPAASQHWSAAMPSPGRRMR